MNTPVYDFVKRYADLRPARFHMPGHKGRGPLGCEEWDLTEIPGADSLFEADGIIAESEANASALFGCPTFYSTEGSSHCIRAMLFLACKARQGIKDQGAGSRGQDRLRVLAARNCHKAFLSAVALLDLDAAWLPASEDSYLSAQPTPELLASALRETGADAVYLTCPDYLGFLPNLGPLAEVCHAHGALLLADNAHGAYLRFLNPSQHPMDLGADLCCDSAHKTLPVLTGGAYLHVSNRLLSEAGRETRPLRFEDIRDALALFGSSSPSYLILQSLDLANPYLEALPERLADFLPKVDGLKSRLSATGWAFVGDEPMKLTMDLRPGAAPAAPPGALRRAETVETVVETVGTSIACPPCPPYPPCPSCPPCPPCPPSSPRSSGTALAAELEQAGIYCEFSDADYLVLMLTPQNTEEELARLEAALTKIRSRFPLPVSQAPPNLPSVEGCERSLPPREKERVCSIREAMLSASEQLPARESLGRVLARPGVSCPPAVPILMPGERIDEAAVAAFARYGIETVSVIP